MKFNRKKIFRYLLIAVILLIIVAIIGKRAGFFGKETIYKICTEMPEKRKIIETITANGKVQPETEVSISPDVSGEIVDLYIKDGQEVKEGDLLLKIKPDIYISMLERMQASLNSAKANLENSKARQEQVKAQFDQVNQSFSRSKKLWEQKAISQSEFETAQSNFDASKADVEASKQTVNAAAFAVNSAEASLKEANENLTKTSIYAPINGTISKLNIEKGERVVGTVQMAGTELLRIADLNLMEVKVDVNENDIVRVSLNDTAMIEIDAYLGKKFRGVVTEMANSASTTGAIATDQVTNFEVKIRILRESYLELLKKDNPNYYPFRPGMSATVDIQTETKLDVLSVPIQAVTTRADSSLIDTTAKNIIKADKQLKEIVFIYKDGVVNSREVKTGIQDDNNIEITTGLTTSDEVVVAPYSAISKKLKDKLKVVKVPKDKLFEEK